MTQFLEIALDCIRRGWYVFPCKPGAKQPLGALAPNGWYDASNDEAVIREWWRRAPQANVAIACNLSRLAVADIDHGANGPADLPRIKAALGLERDTYMVHTGRRPEFGVQAYMSDPIPDVGAWEKDGFSGQIKSLGGYVMAAGCLHPSGERYEVICDAPLAPTTPTVRGFKSVTKQVSTEPGKKIPEGSGRHDALMRVACSLRNRGMDGATIYAAMLPINDAMCEVPISDDELLAMCHGIERRYPAGEQEPQVIVGRINEQPDAAVLPERVRPVYPDSAWEGTVIAEFAKLCAHDNNIPRKLYAEAFRCALGAVVGDRITCPGVEGAVPRTYTVIVAPKGKGKGTAIRRAVRFFNQSWDALRNGSAKSGILISCTPGLLSGERDFIWKPKGVGAWLAAASSVPGMARLCKDLDATLKSKPHMSWGSTLPRILSVHEEMKTLLSALFIEGGVGSGLEGVVCQLWDDVTFHGTATGTREAAYGEMQFGGSSIVRPRFAGIARQAGVQRFALEIFNGALLRTSPSFMLRWEPRFAELSGNPNPKTV